MVLERLYFSYCKKNMALINIKIVYVIYYANKRKKYFFEY